MQNVPHSKNYLIPLISIISITIALRLYDFLNHDKIEQKKKLLMSLHK